MRMDSLSTIFYKGDKLCAAGFYNKKILSKKGLL